jgi:hypothetical protein
LHACRNARLRGSQQPRSSRIITSTSCAKSLAALVGGLSCC